uniref:Chemokine interleukin-8-like domain-containing protein n=1 Tax=Xiphophorus couchianus TaxID=32473 RepID=A0A3B5L4W2_9TELE
MPYSLLPPQVRSVYGVDSAGLTMPLCQLCSKYCASGPDDCCFQFFRNPVNKNLISSYFRTDSRCPISAVVLITQRARRICVDSQEKWVEKIVKHLEKKIL